MALAGSSQTKLNMTTLLSMGYGSEYHQPVGMIAKDIFSATSLVNTTVQVYPPPTDEVIGIAST